MKLAAILAGVLLMAAARLAGDEALTLSVYPEMSVEPANILVTAMVTPNTENRAIEVSADSGEYMRSSTVALDGDKAARSTVFEYHEMPAGDYEVTGVLIGRDGKPRAVVRRILRVMP